MERSKAGHEVPDGAKDKPELSPVGMRSLEQDAIGPLAVGAQLLQSVVHLISGIGTIT